MLARSSVFIIIHGFSKPGCSLWHYYLLSVLSAYASLSPKCTLSFGVNVCTCALVCAVNNCFLFYRPSQICEEQKFSKIAVNIIKLLHQFVYYNAGLWHQPHAEYMPEDVFPGQTPLHWHLQTSFCELGVMGSFHLYTNDLAISAVTKVYQQTYCL